MASRHEVMVQFSDLLWIVAAVAAVVVVLAGIGEYLDRRDHGA
jgi:hypothetical protein